MKFWFFRHYWWSVPLVSVLVLAAIRFLAGDLNPAVSLPVAGGFLSLFYFVQKQRLEEMRLFREIFADCNRRYSELNDALNAIVDGLNNTALTAKEAEVVMDYFNLCAEECLYFEEGYLLPSVWKAWHAGMRTYFQNPRIAELWQKEKSTHDSYYGLEPWVRQLTEKS